MKKKKSLLAAISAFTITLSAAIIALPEVATAENAVAPYTITPIEDLIDTRNDFEYQVGSFLWTAEENELQSDGTRNIAVYTEKTTETNENNKNDYDGNITTYVSSPQIHGLWLDEDWNTLTKLRVNYNAGNALWFSARKSSYNGTSTWVSATEGYSFRIGVNASSLGYTRITKFTKAVNKNNTADTVQEKTVMDGKNLTNTLTDGQKLEIVFGAYDVTDENYTIGTYQGAGTYLYFEIIDVATGNTLSLIHVKDTVETTLLDGSKNTSVYRTADNQKNYMQIIPCINTSLSNTSSLAIQGVNQPILNDVYDYTVEKEYASGTTVADIELPEGYAIQNGQTLALGANKLKATYTLAEYYGNTDVEIDCTVTVAVIPYTTVNIEDAADTLSDIPWHKKDANITTTNEILNDGTIDYALYTEAADVENEDTNPNTYKGNLGVYLSSAAINGFTMDRGWNDLVRFKMNYIDGDTTWLWARKSVFNRYTWVSAYEGYSFRINSNKTVSVKRQTGASDANCVTITSKGTAQNFVDGEILDITYGAYDVTDETYDYNGDGTPDGSGTYVYFKIVGQKVNIELHAKDSDPTALYRSDSESTKNYMQIAICMNTSWYKGPVSIQGVNQPILNDVYDYTLDAAATEGDDISSLAAPANYTIASTGKLSAGENRLNAKYATTYNGVQIEIDCKIIVTAEPLVRYEVKRLNADDTEIASEQVIAGTEYVLPEATASEGKKFIGWKIGDGLYQAGDIITVDGNVTMQVAEVAFGQLNKASIRMKDDENGNGGIRFMATLTGTDSITGSYAWKGFIMPKNLVTGLDETTIDRAAKNGVLMTVSDLTQTEVYFALSSLKETSYATEFVCVSYLEVTYADGDAVNVFAWSTLEEAQASARSAKYVAEQALADEKAVWSDAQKEYLNRYAGVAISE